ncbi:MAG TPA: exopolysaccharide biosynthesis polyprenyl glycosylphosphotransferase [Gaiellaceae bacterium]|nr:exopolysaccharide biosynthesis polyprenyl glycosylphosphotransferase [Gaiellaceae bacterium]
MLTGVVFAATLTIARDGSARSAAEALAVIPLWLLVAKVLGLYDRDHRTLRHLTADELPVLLLWLLGAGVSTGLIADGNQGVSTAILIALGVAAVVAICDRALARAVWRRVVPRARVVIVGDGPVMTVTRRKLELFRETHADVVAELTLEEGRRLAQRHFDLRPDRVIVASGSFAGSELAELLAYCRATGIRLSVVPRAHERTGSIVGVTHLGGLATLEYNTWDISRSTLLLKRILDIVVASVGLVLLLPLGLAIGAAIFVDDPSGSIFFGQDRAGFHGRPFRMWKFRTMVPDAEQRLSEHVKFDDLEHPMFKLHSDPRVTRVGRLLRRLSLDELPQLFNVLRGEMSLVGPRPEQVALVARYSDEHRVRLNAKPGMTGPMQIYGRAELAFDERLVVERDYIENVSFGRDLRILALTLAPIMQRSGAF